MKHSIQINILVIPIGIAVHGPFNEQNNAIYKSLGGRFDRLGRRWILPNNEEVWLKLAELFGEDGPIVIVVIPPRMLTIFHGQLQFGGYVIAIFNTQKGCVQVAEGVEVVGGKWDEAASAARNTPYVSNPNAVLHVVMRRSMAEKHGLTIIKELENQPIPNPLAPYADSDLQVELESRGYKVEEILC